MDAAIPVSLSFPQLQGDFTNIQVKPVASYSHSSLFDVDTDARFGLDLDLDTLIDALVPEPNADGTMGGVVVCVSFLHTHSLPRMYQHFLCSSTERQKETTRTHAHKSTHERVYTCRNTHAHTHTLHTH